MFVTSITPLNNTKANKRFRVRLEGADFILYKREIARYDIKEGEEIPEETYKALLEEVFIPRAKSRALHLLEKQDRTKANLISKLKESGYPKEAIDIAIGYVSDYNYINDLRYARNYILYKRQSKSERIIRMDLSEKGIDKNTIEDAVFSLEEELEEDVFNDLSILYDIAIKKYSSCDNPDSKFKQKLYNHLMRKGFTPADILSTLNDFEFITTS